MPFPFTDQSVSTQRPAVSNYENDDYRLPADVVVQIATLLSKAS